MTNPSPDAAHALKALDSNASTLNGTAHDDNASATISLQNLASHAISEHRNSEGGMVITPEPRSDRVLSTTQTTPSTPGLLPQFDWHDFQSRYEKALGEADEYERVVLDEFEHLSKYFHVWASASATHDNGRATKRLQTRQRYVTLSEESMAQKQKHYDEVLRAFQSALALLSSK